MEGKKLMMAEAGAQESLPRHHTRLNRDCHLKTQGLGSLWSDGQSKQTFASVLIFKIVFFPS